MGSTNFKFYYSDLSDFYNRNSARTMAHTASITGGTLSAKQASCLPFIWNVSILPVDRLKLCWGLLMLDVGLIATLKISGFPFVIPPFIPPAEFLEVFPQ